MSFMKNKLHDKEMLLVDLFSDIHMILPFKCNICSNSAHSNSELLSAAL